MHCFTMTIFMSGLTHWCFSKYLFKFFFVTMNELFICIDADVGTYVVTYFSTSTGCHSNLLT